MAGDEIRKSLTANVGRLVRITFDDGVTQTLNIGSVDDEGFLHSGPDGVNPLFYWTRFESVMSIEPDDSPNT